MAENETLSFIVIEDEEKRPTSYLTKHFGGNFIASEAGLGDADNSRSNLQLRLRYQEDWQNGLVVAEYIGYGSKVDLTLSRGEDGDPGPTQSFEVMDNEWREA